LKAIEDYIVSLLKKPKEGSSEIQTTGSSSSPPPVEPNEGQLLKRSASGVQNSVNAPIPDYKFQWKKKAEVSTSTVQMEQTLPSSQVITLREQ
jgi:hypothetical protein